ncbi:MAG: Asp-tRNA(Asn)/Glu-tRNA(Gln) amidotransferase subunit GatA [Chloroflexi bacterium]|nr:Asp-tRNA(Asn)/Glu-tRNA(Gln) amidotransferase subunit GatA [Chloroflexota bacterium]
MINYTITQAAELLHKKQISAVELTKEYLQNIANTENRVHAFTQLNEKQALDSAQHADQKLHNGSANKLTGIPIAIKDIMNTVDWRTTCSSKMLENYQSVYDATCISKLKERGMVIVGKTNMDEFAMGSSTETSAFFKTFNPWNLEYVPGGSSGGSAACIAANQAICSLGTDTGGSIRQPASFCSVTGFKPTYGRVSRYGVVAFASSLDQVGTFTKDAHDAAILLEALCGADSKDSTSAKQAVPAFSQDLRDGVRGLRIGVPKEYFAQGINPQVESLVRKAVQELQNHGAIVKEISLPNTKYALAVYYIIAPSEASANLARFDGVKYGLRADGNDMWQVIEKTRGQGFGDEVLRRIMIGTYALSAGYYDAWYLKAQKVRTLIKAEFTDAFKEVDIICAPTAPVLPFKSGEKIDDPLAMYLADICTIPINIAGLPGMSIPCGFANGLPVGLQIIGRPFDEQTILNTAHTYQKLTSFHKEQPKL